MIVNDILVLTILAVGIKGQEAYGEKWFDSSIENLSRAQLIHEGNSCHTLTTRGEAYLKLLKDTPLPVQQWVDPRNLK